MLISSMMKNFGQTTQELPNFKLPQIGIIEFHSIDSKAKFGGYDDFDFARSPSKMRGGLK